MFFKKLCMKLETYFLLQWFAFLTYSVVANKAIITYSILNEEVEVEIWQMDPYIEIDTPKKLQLT